MIDNSVDDRWYLFEDVEEGTGMALSPASVDTQIDSLLVTFEEAAAEVEDEVVVPEGISMRDMLLMLEADEDEDKADEDEDTVTNNDVQKTDEPATPLAPKINIDEFTSRVATLIQTYTNRLDIETVIFNRAKNYLENEHGSSAAKQFEDIMISEHDIDLRQNAPEDPEPNPQAVGAMGPSPG